MAGRSAVRAGKWQQVAMLAPALMLLALCVLVPFAMTVWFSFTDQRLVPRPIPTRFVAFRNYLRVLGDPEFWQAMRNTILFAAAVVPFQLSIALGGASVLNARFPGRAAVRSLSILPLLMPMTVVAAIWALLYRIPDGPLNAVLQLALGRGTYVDWLGDPSWALPAIVLLSAWATFPFQMLVYLAALQHIRSELYEAARMDGAGTWQQFRHVTWPGLRNANVFLAIVTTIGALKLFTQVAILTGGGPDGATTTVIYYLFREGYQSQRIGHASAVAVVFFLAVAIIATALRRALARDAGR